MKHDGFSPQDEEDLDVIANCIDRGSRSFASAFLIALMMAYAVSAVSSSPGKTLLLGTVFFVVACFSASRRYLQPIGLAVFLVAAVYNCIDETKIGALLETR